MRLVSNASQSQIETGIRLVDTLGSNRAAHRTGLQALLDWKEISNVEVIEMLNTEVDLVRKYAAIAAKRRLGHSPELIQYAITSDSELVSRFANEAVDQDSG